MTPAKVVRSGIAARDRRRGYANSHGGVGDTYQTVPGLFGRARFGRVMTTHELETYDDCVRDLLDECPHCAPILRAPATTRAPQGAPLMSQLVSIAIIVVAAYAAGELGALVSLAAFSGVCFYVGMPLWAAFGLWMLR